MADPSIQSSVLSAYESLVGSGITRSVTYRSYTTFFDPTDGSPIVEFVDSNLTALIVDENRIDGSTRGVTFTVPTSQLSEEPNSNHKIVIDSEEWGVSSFSSTGYVTTIILTKEAG